MVTPRTGHSRSPRTPAAHCHHEESPDDPKNVPVRAERNPHPRRAGGMFVFRPQFKRHWGGERRCGDECRRVWASSSIRSLSFGYFVADFEGEELGVTAAEDLPTGRAVVLDVAAEAGHGKTTFKHRGVEPQCQAGL
jgi:hypothetical protein